jgi:hypothetical protein
MKKSLLSCIAIVALVASALSFKAINRFSSGSVYCTNTCAIKVAFRIDPAGLNIAPCGSGHQPYVYSICGGTYSCVATLSGMTFTATTDAGK